MDAIAKLSGKKIQYIVNTSADPARVGGNETLRKAGVTVGPVYTIADAVADAHFRERGILVDVEDAELGAVPMHNIVPRLSQSAGAWRRPAPRLGEHTDAVLAEAGFDGEAIARMRQEGVL